MVGYENNGYRLWDGTRIIESRDVKFDESKLYYKINNVMSNENPDVDTINGESVDADMREKQELVVASREKEILLDNDKSEKKDGAVVAAQQKMNEVSDESVVVNKQKNVRSVVTENNSDKHDMVGAIKRKYSVDADNIPNSVDADKRRRTNDSLVGAMKQKQSVDSAQDFIADNQNKKTNELSVGADILNNSNDLKVNSQTDMINNKNDTVPETRPRRTKRLPSKFKDYDMYFETNEGDNCGDDSEEYVACSAESYIHDIPQSYAEVKIRPDRPFWEKAMRRELNSLRENHTWDVVDRPSRKEILDARWVYAYKPLEEVLENRYKARLVVRGFAQTKVFDFGETYAPVAKLTTIRTLLAVGNEKKFFFHQLDVKTAFLNGDVKSEIYINPPEGLDSNKGIVFKLRKALYGLKESAKCWHDHFSGFLLDIGFRQSENDSCLYIKKYHNHFVYLIVYVDDIIVASESMKVVADIKARLMSRFKMTDKGILKHFLGFSIDYNPTEGRLIIDQRRYIQNLLIKFNMTTCNGVSSPIESRLILDNDLQLLPSSTPFRELVGCLMYLCYCSRPDIAFAVHYFSQQQDKATHQAFKYLKRILRYLKTTINLVLTYERGGDTVLKGYADADFANGQDRKSISGHCFMIGKNLLSWTVKKQACVALSTAEAELISLTLCLCEGIWLKRLLADFNMYSDLVLFEDNRACIQIIKTPDNNKRIKHSDVKLKYVCQAIKLNKVKIEHISSDKQIADIFTKGLPSGPFMKHVKSLNLK